MDNPIADTPQVSDINTPQKTFLPFIVAGAIIILILIISILFFLPKKGTPSSSPTLSQNTSNQVKTSRVNIPKNSSLVYGYWTPNNTVIKNFDLASEKETASIILPRNMKHITLLSSHELLYIADTDQYDHGKEIVLYDTETQKSKTILSAADGFGIDDYVVSPDKQYIADWEVQFAQNSSVLQGGKSRVYSLHISELNQKHLLYDETATVPVHYPRAITDSGEVFTDTFLPNSGEGWAYGMSTSDFTGAVKTDISSMQNGTYSSQPSLSSDGTYLAFAGYDGSKGAGTTIVNDVRQALSTPNTVELLDTATNQRIRLPDYSSKNTYISVAWDSTLPQTLDITELKNDTHTITQYTYNIKTAAKTVIAPPSGYLYTASIDPTHMIVSQVNTSDTTVGNLGSTYSPAATTVAIYDASSRTLHPLSLDTSLVQFIQAGTASLASEKSTESTSNNTSLQLATFSLKPSLAPVRIQQQSAPPPAASTPQFPGCISLAQNSGICSPSDSSCIQSVISQGLVHCTGSPLYVYGPSGIHLSATVYTSFAGANVPYTHHAFDITLENNDRMNVNGKTVDGITYSYLPAKQFAAPTQGIGTDRNNLSKTIQWYAQKLDLNTKETNNLLAFGNSYITSPYVFVSLYDEKESEQILPLSFNPKPNSYTNIVFYFKELNEKSINEPESPEIQPIKRTGPVSVVEISEMVEKE